MKSSIDLVEVLEKTMQNCWGFWFLQVEAAKDLRVVTWNVIPHGFLPFWEKSMLHRESKFEMLKNSQPFGLKAHNNALQMKSDILVADCERIS